MKRQGEERQTELSPNWGRPLAACVRPSERRAGNRVLILIWSKSRTANLRGVRDRPTVFSTYIFLPPSMREDHKKIELEAVRGPNGSDMRTVWDIDIKPYAKAHLVTFPSSFIEPGVRLSTDLQDLALYSFIGIRQKLVM